MMYKASDMLEKDDRYTPLLRRQQPLWRHKPVPAHRQVHIPRWVWDNTAGLPAHQLYVDLDVNAAYLSAASSGTFAHGALERDHRPAWQKRPGYYLIDAHAWQHPGIMSPLGTADDLPDRVWVMHPTVALLTNLSEAGYWPGVTIHDAYTCPGSVRLRKWAEAIRDARADARRARDAGEPGAAERYDAVKNGYVQAIQMLTKAPTPVGTPRESAKKNYAYRPDWYATIHAQHAAMTWRKAWRCLDAGHGPVAAGSTDRLTYTLDDYQALLHLARTSDRPPLIVDPYRLGAFKTDGDAYVIDDLPEAYAEGEPCACPAGNRCTDCGTCPVHDLEHDPACQLVADRG